MKVRPERRNLRPSGKGFITHYSEGLIGRKLTETFMDQDRKLFVIIDGELTPLTDQHRFMAVE